MKHLHRVRSCFNLWPDHVLLLVYTCSDAEDWFCECPPLYTGRLCQFTACERSPCSHGATCIPKSPLEAVCLCPYGRQGLLCDERKCPVKIHSNEGINRKQILLMTQNQVFLLKTKNSLIFKVKLGADLLNTPNESLKNLFPINCNF